MKEEKENAQSYKAAKKKERLERKENRKKEA